MRRTRDFVQLSWMFAVLTLLLLASALPVSAQLPQSGGVGRGTRASISGTVRDFDSHTPLEGAKVDLHATNGGVVSTVFTTSTGAFQFDGLRTGRYSLSIVLGNYDQLTQDVTVEGGPVMSLDLLLRQINGARPQDFKANKVSTRELAIPSKARDAMERGMRLLYDKSDSNGAIAEFQRALKLYPDYYEASMQIGIAYSRLGDNSSAEQILHKTLAMNPNYADAYGALALVLCDEKKFAEAEPPARKAVELDQSSWQANYELGRALYGLDRSGEAEPVVQAALKLKLDDGPMHLLLANIHVKLRNYPALLDDLNAYLKIEPTGADADHARDLREKVQQAIANSQTAPAQPPNK